MNNTNKILIDDIENAPNKCLDIDFDEVINRTKIYKDQERKRDENCNLLKQARRD